jgi:hypothetical protein
MFGRPHMIADGWVDPSAGAGRDRHGADLHNRSMK